MFVCGQGSYIAPKIMPALVIGLVIALVIMLESFLVSNNSEGATKPLSAHRFARAAFSGRNDEDEQEASPASQDDSTTQSPASSPSTTRYVSIAEQLKKTVRVLCWVMTQPVNHQMKAEHVKHTWGKRCNVVLFMSSMSNDALPAIQLPVQEGRNHLWSKTKEAFKYIYEHHRNDADWFLKADDDTYVIVENLRYMLSNYSSKDPIYFGCRFKPFIKQGYMSGGAGYVLSREALDRFVNRALPNSSLCREGHTGPEDVNIGNCLENVGVRAIDSRDERGRGRFFPFTIRQHLFPNQDTEFWYWNYLFYPAKEGLDCCSDYAITFHYISPQQMHVLDYLLYHLRPYGFRHQSHSHKSTKKQVVMKLY